MNRPRHCNRFPAALVGVACVLASSMAYGQFGFLKGSKSDFKTFTDPGRHFQLEYPKDWQATAGVGDVLVTFAQRKGEAALVIEKFHLNQVPGQITDLFAQIEADTLKERQPQATDVAYKVVASNGQQIITIDYGRPGLSGQERGRQYSFPIGQDLYRLNCTAVAALFVKYDPVFVHIASSFAPASAPPGAAAAPTPPQNQR